uniref:ATP synthase subunit a n=1 Tax=Lyonsia norwegica TaxID=228471 RepID=A0A1U9XPG7_LYONO|nr:ATP synthase F0 subunit 6 [Lyonsia norwegica]AQZ26149.1 ATP synthase subunit 6 [Lyonsia norwegica]
MSYDLFAGFDDWNFNLWASPFMMWVWLFTVGILVGSSHRVQLTNADALLVGLLRWFWALPPIAQTNAHAVRCLGVFHLLFSLGFFLLATNLYGMFPYTFGWSSHLPVVMTLAFVFWGSCVMHRVWAWSWGPISASFMMFSVCGWLLPLVVMGEIISVCMRPLALMLRLLVNITIGHLFLGFLAQATVLGSVGGSVVMTLTPLVFLWGITVAELGVAVLQSYVFFMLICLYWLEEDPMFW